MPRLGQNDRFFEELTVDAVASIIGKMVEER